MSDRLRRSLAYRESWAHVFALPGYAVGLGILVVLEPGTRDGGDKVAAYAAFLTVMVLAVWAGDAAREQLAGPALHEPTPGVIPTPTPAPVQLATGVVLDEARISELVDGLVRDQVPFDRSGLPGDLRGYVEQVRAVPWFRHVGSPDPRDPTVHRSGPRPVFLPEEPESGWLDDVLVAAESQVAEAAGDARAAAADTVARLRTWMIHDVGPRIGYDHDDDYTVPEWVAMQQAMFVVETLALAVAGRSPVPRTLLDAWSWYRTGHDVLGLTVEPADPRRPRLVVH